MEECEKLRASMTESEVRMKGRALPPLLALHLESCPECRAYRDEMSRLEEEIRRTAHLAVPPGVLVHLKGIPARHRRMVRERNRILVPTLLVIMLSLLSHLVGGDAAFWLSSTLTLTAAFTAVATLTRSRLTQN